MENTHSKIREEADHLLKGGRDYLATYFEWSKVRLVRKGSNWGAVLLIKSLQVVLVLFLLLFLSIALAWWLGQYLQNIALGFLITGSIYAFFLLLVFMLRKQILVPYIREIILKLIIEDEKNNRPLP